MTTLQNWLAGSWLLGWLARKLDGTNPFEHSYITRFFRAFADIVTDVLRGSFLLSWVVADVPGSEIEGYRSSTLVSVTTRIKDAVVNLLWKLGEWFRNVLEGSVVWNQPMGFLGLLVFFFIAAHIGVNEPRGRQLAVEIVLATLGLAATLLRPTSEWWTSSLTAKFLGWWNEERSSQPSALSSKLTEKSESTAAWKPTTDYSLFLVVSYVIVDFMLRTSPLAFLAGLWDELLFIVIIGIWIIRIGVQKLDPQGTRLLIPFLIYLCVYVFLFMINSVERGQAIEGLRVYLEYVLWFFIGANLLFGKSQFRWLCDVFLLMVCGVALYGVYQYYVGVEIPASWTDSKVETTLRTRVFSIIGSPNILGGLLVLALPMAFANILKNKHLLKKFVYLLVFLVMAACLVFTFSRGAWLAFGLAIILLSMWLDKRIIWVLLITAILTPIALPQVYDRLAYMTTPQYQASSERGGRLGRWAQAVNYWRNSPTTGVGLGMYGGAVAARYNPEGSKYTDNFYLKTGVEAGWIGLAAFLLLALLGVRLARSRVDSVEDPYTKALGLAVLAGLVGVLAHNAVENVFEVPMMATYFWFFLGLLVALPGAARSD